MKTSVIAHVCAKILCLCLVALGAAVIAPTNALAVYQCGNQKDDCKCGGNNPYPCCDNGSNCTWWAWEAACCNWGVALPGWGNANTWGSNASKNGNFSVSSNPTSSSVGTRTGGTYGHVVYVESVDGATVHVSEMNCCGGCNYGMRKWSYNKSYFDSGYVTKKGATGPVCGNGKCEGGENCSNCSQDCGGCCGNGQCDNGENCASCSKDCGNCCGNGKCDNGENCASCDKDCGGCCGNGQCDNGENCSTCDKDCGKCCGNGKCDYGETCSSCKADCICPPVGAIDGATCTSVRGWMSDPDTDAAIPVTLRIDGKVEAQFSASAPTAQHGPHGFSWGTSSDYHDGKPHAADVQATDDKTPTVTTLGPNVFLCATGPLPTGMWKTQRTDFAGFEVDRPAGTPDALAIRFVHPPTYAYPLAGQLASCVSPLTDGFDSATASLSWTLGDAHWNTQVMLDATELGSWSGGGQMQLLAGPGQKLCLLATALQEVVVSDAAEVRLDQVIFRKGPWLLTASSDASGWQASLPHQDSVEVRALVGQTASGWIKVWKDLNVSFDQITWRNEREAVPNAVKVQLVGGEVAFDAGDVGAHERSGLQGKRIGIQWSANALEITGEQMRALVADVRVRCNQTATSALWQIQQMGSYALSVDATETNGKLGGLQLDMHHTPGGWYTTGSVRAKLLVTGVIEAVRMTLPPNITGTGLKLEVLQDNVLLWATTSKIKGQREVELPFTGRELVLAFSTEHESLVLPDQVHNVSNIQWLRQGWWSAPSPLAVGLTDDRLDGGGVRIATQAAAGPIAGAWRVNRSISAPNTGIRFDYRHWMQPGQVRARLYRNGDFEHEMIGEGKYSQTIELPGATTEVAFELAGDGTAVAADHVQYLEVSNIQFRDPAGAWQLVPVEVAKTSNQMDAGATDAGAPAASGPGAAAPSGCEASTNPSMAGYAAILLVLIGLHRARRRGKPSF